MGTAPIRVLVVDDSSFMRKALCGMLAGDSCIGEVETARNGEEALQKIASWKPDVVTLDIEMPVMNGLDALRKIMETHPLPVLMVSSLTSKGAEETLQALELGAVDFVPKQLDGVVTNIAGVHHELVAKVIAAAGMVGRIRPRRPVTSRSILSHPNTGLSARSTSATRGSKIVAIGCSTGGPQALSELLPLFPKDFPAGIVIVQHMPKCFTKPFADRMNALCEIDVREASESDEVIPGVALLAPGGLQLRLGRKKATRIGVELKPNLEGHLHAPSVDVMMQSVAQLYAERAVGVILTGMGQDGLEGMRAIKKGKGRTVAQNEASCTVYGMPRAVVDNGCADKVVPLSQIAGEIMNMI
jgi:Chemotaxis response regulator containing a CheY-like receiver domain and a methylesterase domain